MGSEWTSIRLGDACTKIGSGATPRGGKDAYRGGNTALIRSQNIHNDHFAREGIVYIDDAQAHALKNVEVCVGDVLLNITGDSVARCCQVVPDILPARVNQHVAIIRTRPDVLDAKFLRYSLVSPSMQGHLLALASAGATRNALTKTAIESLSIQAPSIEEQRAIAHILGTLDDKIELNRRINQTLEARAQAIFKSWFVDFDLVKAKISAIEQGQDPERAAMRAISGKTDAELDQLPRDQYNQLSATAALFPEAMQDSELGEIPKGWVVKTLSEIASFPNKKIETSGLGLEEYISTENMLPNKAGVTCAASLPSVGKVSAFGEGEVLVSNIRPYFKKIWLAKFDGGRSNDVLAFDSRDPDCKEFLFSLLYQDEFFDFMMRTSKGAKMPRGDKAAIAGWKLAAPDVDLMLAFSEQVKPFFAQVNALDKESKAIGELRDTLLPKLISGELRIPETEAFFRGCEL